MRELMKSMFRLGWAVSLLGVRQMGEMLSTTDGSQRTTAALDALRREAEGRLDRGYGELYRLGDRVQGGVVDAVADVAGGAWSEPGELLARTRDAADRTLTAVAGGAASGEPAR